MKQRFATTANIVDELKEAQVPGQFFLRDTTMGTQSGTEQRPAQIVKLLSASMADVPLPVRLAVMVPSFFDLVRIAARGANPIRPAQLAYYLITLRFVDQLLDTDQARILPHRFLLHLLKIN